MASAKPVFIRLPDRGLITVSGHDRFDFLQDLITNDINLLQTQTALYSCLLTPQGKFLFDFFITQKDDVLYLDCEGGQRAQELAQKLSLYKLRADVTLEVNETHPVYAILFSDTPDHNSPPDPRHPEMGFRSFEKPVEIEEVDFSVWDQHRLRIGIPDGSRDMIPHDSTLLECRIDEFHGVSFDKGCYMGQELTARMHYRNLGKKMLRPVTFTKMPPPPFSPLYDHNGQVAGEMRSSCGLLGLALLRNDVTLSDLHTNTSV